MIPPPSTELAADQLADARDDACREIEIEDFRWDFLGPNAHPRDCDCERCTEDRELD